MKLSRKSCGCKGTKDVPQPTPIPQNPPKPIKTN